MELAAQVDQIVEEIAESQHDPVFPHITEQMLLRRGSAHHGLEPGPPEPVLAEYGVVRGVEHLREELPAGPGTGGISRRGGTVAAVGPRADGVFQVNGLKQALERVVFERNMHSEKKN